MKHVPPQVTHQASDGVLEILQYRALLWTFALREIKVRYKQAVLGAAWAVLQPLSLMVVFTLFFSILLNVSSDGIPYPLFVYSALLPWTFFSTSLAFAIPSLTNNAQLITKVYFPRAILPLASVLAAGFDFCIAGLVFCGMMLFYQVRVTIDLLWVFPLLLIQVAFTVAVAFFFSALNVTYRDVRHAMPLLIQLWMFATPVIYSVSVVPERYRALYLMNPMAAVIDGFRKVLVQGHSPDLWSLSPVAATSVILLWAAYRYFKRAEEAFADVI